MARLYVMSAPSGAGKTTLRAGLQALRPDLCYSVSYTTRPTRAGEVDGRDYHFITSERFQGMVRGREFLEWAEVFGRYYGTGRAWVEERLARGVDVLADVDVAGARHIKENFPAAILIFVVPPTLAELARRLRDRRTETEEQLTLRLERAREEINESDRYDYLVVNDDVARAVRDLDAILAAERCRLPAPAEFWATFFGPA